MLEECHVGLADAIGVGDVFPVGRRARKADPTSVVKYEAHVTAEVHSEQDASVVVGVPRERKSCFPSYDQATS